MSKLVRDFLVEDLQYQLEGKLSDVITNLKRLHDKYGSTARLDVGVGNDYGTEYVYVHLYASREETDKEYAQRIKAEEAQKASREKYERDMLARLQEKYKEK